MGKRWIDIWIVFINLDFEMRFDNFIRATCVLYILCSVYRKGLSEACV